jgi:hypothetical protein
MKIEMIPKRISALLSKRAELKDRSEYYYLKIMMDLPGVIEAWVSSS